jgi:hypothetical protein
VSSHISGTGRGFAAAAGPQPSHMQGIFSSTTIGPGGEQEVIGRINDGKVTGITRRDGNVTRFSGTLPPTSGYDLIGIGGAWRTGSPVCYAVPCSCRRRLHRAF